jgi:hypothetical protein
VGQKTGVKRIPPLRDVKAGQSNTAYVKLAAQIKKKPPASEI